jgi:hypothetical protein
MTAVGALMVGSAFAQSAPNQGNGQSTPPAATTTMPKSSDRPADAVNTDASKGTTSGTTNTASPAQPISSQQADQWVASKFKGMDVLGADNKKVGDISDILFDQNGQVLAYIVSVGGFLGVGSKYVALPPSAFQVVSGDQPATTGSATGTNGASPADKKLKIATTEEQLKAAANFEYYKEPTRAAAPTRPAPTGSPMRPAGAPTGVK